MNDTLNLDHDNILETLNRLINEDEKEKISISNLDSNQIWVLLEKISRRILSNKNKFNISEIEKELKQANKKFERDYTTLKSKRQREEEDDQDQDDEEMQGENDDENLDEEMIEDDEENYPDQEEEYATNNKRDKFFSMQELKNIADEDLGEDENSKEEDEEEDENVDEDAKDVKYEDFFNDPSAPVQEKDEDFEDEDIEDNIFEQEDRIMSEGDKYTNTRTIEEINEIEEKMMKDKPWHMKGEVKANHRPKESLLENPVDFQVINKPPPIPDSNYTEAIENLIKLRIRDDLFDDPVRKLPVDSRTKEQFELNFQKSKKGLGEIYEEEYTGEQATETEVTGIKKEIDELTSSLYGIFDKLTNNNFVSTVRKAEMKLTPNIPAIQIEEISNYVTDNKATTKSAGELFNLKDAQLRTREELTKEERGTQHNKWKRNVRNKLREKQRNIKLKEISKSAGSKFEAKLMMKQAKDKSKKNVKNSELKSSKFFTNLQTIASEDQTKRKLKNEDRGDYNTKQAKKFKL